jgi:hypothetical protein
VYRQLIAILLLLSISYQSFVKLGIVIWYQVNKEYVARNLCENKNQPEKKCCGKCYLNKQLNKADKGTTEKNSSVPQKWNLGEVIDYTLPQIVCVLPYFYSESMNIHHTLHLSFSLEGTYTPVFHPPSYC